MPRIVLIAVFTDTNLRLLSVSLGLNPDIQTSSEIYPANSESELQKSFTSCLNQVSNFSNDLALIIPFTWIDSDGKISKQKKSLISALCKKHNLKPIGFMPGDEAVLDYFSKEQGIPSSPVLIEVTDNLIYVSLSDMGVVNKRSNQSYQDRSQIPTLSQKLIYELKREDSLTPKIFVWGNFDRQDILNFNNFPWIGKDQADIFLHFPDIIFFDLSQLNKIYLNSINNQINKFTADDQPNSSDINNIDNVDNDSQENLVEVNQDLSDQSDTLSLDQVDASEFGFIKDTGIKISDQFDTQIDEPSLPLVFNPTPNPTPPQSSEFIKPVKPRFKLPSINRLGKIKVLPIILLSLFIILPILAFILFYKIEITLFVKPADINLSDLVDINPDISASDFDQKIIAVKKEQKTLTVTDQIKTTGSITKGENAQGKVVIFNKTDESISLSKGQILSTKDGIKFVLLNDTQVDSSSLDLEEGTISMGKTVAVAKAFEIGSQGNIVQDTALSLDNFTSSQLIARVEESFAGGSSRQVASVASADKISLEEILLDKINQDINQNQPDTENNYLLKSTIDIKQGTIEYNREVGEETDTLSGTLDSTITYYSLNPSEINDIIDMLIRTNSQTPIDIESSRLFFDFSTSSDFSGTLSVSGLAVSQINFDNLKKQVTFKNIQNIYPILTGNVKQIYDYNVQTNNPFGKLPLSPLLPDNISFIVKIES